MDFQHIWSFQSAEEVRSENYDVLWTLLHAFSFNVKVLRMWCVRVCVKHVFIVRAHYFFSVWKHITVFRQVTRYRNKNCNIWSQCGDMQFWVVVGLWMLSCDVLSTLSHQRAATTCSVLVLPLNFVLFIQGLWFLMCEQSWCFCYFWFKSSSAHLQHKARLACLIRFI